MKYLYSLPSLVRILIIIIVLLTIVINIVSILVNAKGKLKKINIFYYLSSVSFVVYLLIHLGVIASVQRHLTENMVSFDYYFVLRYLATIPIALVIIDIIISKRYLKIIDAVLMILLLPVFDLVFKNIYPYIFIASTIYFLVFGLSELLLGFEKAYNEITIFSIKEALDKLPIGIIFADENEKIIFINQKCNDILLSNNISSKIKITSLWDEIKAHDETFAKSEDTALLRLNDISYMLALEKINSSEKSKYQIKSTDVTEEIVMLSRIENANKILETQENELRDNIYKLNEIESQKSLIKIKGRIHDVFAQRLSIIHQYLDNENIKDVSVKELKKLINDMVVDIKEEKTLDKEEIKQSLISSYDLIGMKIIFDGNIKDEYADSILKIIREAATNALRHGEASELYVNANEDEITITNNGLEPDSIKEGNGLKNMRFTASEAKLNLNISYNPFTIIIKYS